MDCRIRQTPTASPAEPGGLLLTLERPSWIIRAGQGARTDANKPARPWS